MSNHFSRACLTFTFAAAAAAALSACTTNPTTGRKQFNALSRDEEITMGAQALPGISAEFGGKVNSPALQAYIAEVGSKLAAQTEADNPRLPWEYTLLNSTVINAFALPGGKVFITRGLADKLTNEAQLAGVLGHEVGHVTARHTNDRIAEATGAQIGVAVLGAVVGAAAKSDAAGQSAANIAGQAAQLGLLLPHSRNQEYEADSLGVRYMTKAGYNPIGQVQVMQVLQREGGGSASDEWMATHPYAGNRVTRLQGIIAKDYPTTQNNPAFATREDLYQQRYLSKLAGLPPATAPQAAAAPQQKQQQLQQQKQNPQPPRQGQKRSGVVPVSPGRVLAQRGVPGDAAAQGTADARALAVSEATLGDPVLWCAHCRAAAVSGTAAVQ